MSWHARCNFYFSCDVAMIVQQYFWTEVEYPNIFCLSMILQLPHDISRDELTMRDLNFFCFELISTLVVRL